ncbi:MAG TPA: hypothetical protein VF407_19220, partial [Polyangiaceae bacterium]
DVPCAETRGYVCESARSKTPDPGDACDPCPANYDPSQKALVGLPDGGVDLGPDLVDGGPDAGPIVVCKSVN